MPEFEVAVRRTAIHQEDQTATINVRASSPTEARRIAEEMLKDSSAKID